MSMIFELHTVAVDGEYSFSKYLSILNIVFINNILHLQILAVGFWRDRGKICIIIGSYIGARNNNFNNHSKP